MKTCELELAVAEHFGVRTHLMVPNVYWGFGLRYEADLVVVTESRYAYEIELKVSKSDLKADAKKRHTHDGKHFKRLYFAMPEEIYEPELVPERAGVLLAKNIPKYVSIAGTVCPARIRIELKRRPKENKAIALTDKQYQKLLRLCSMRIWTLKKQLVKEKNNRQLEFKFKED